MWIFGYGSLMWDPWEAAFGCVRKEQAELLGFRREFNKASVERWGTNEHKCPTLNLTRDVKSKCSGYAFAFAEDKRPAVQTYLKKREGGFDFTELSIVLTNGDRVTATTPIYAGRNLIKDVGLRDRAEMARVASGHAGKCEEYVRSIAAKLAELGIDDPVVRAFQEML